MAAPMRVVTKPNKLLNLCLCKHKTLNKFLVSGGKRSVHVDLHNILPKPRITCRTTLSDPTLHTDTQQGLFYTINPDEAKLYYGKGYKDHVPLQFNAFNEAAVMVRKPALEMIANLKDTCYDHPVIRYVFYGRFGAGKSMSMSHVMHYCGVNDWLILHVPWAAKYITRPRDASVSISHPGRVDLNGMSMEWLNYFQQINAPFLEKHQLTVEGRYSWSKRDHTEPGTPLKQLLNYALERPKSANDILNVLLKEIKIQANQDKLKALVAIDGVNCFWQDTIIKREENRTSIYHASELSLVQAWKKMLKNDWKNGAVLCTVDRTASIPEHRDSDLPMYLLRKEGFEHLDPFVPISVDHYSLKELYSCLEYYVDRNFIYRPEGLTDDEKKELTFLSCRNPFELFKLARMW